MNTTQLTPFQFDSTRVRTITDDQGSIWFVAADVCEALTISNSRDAISRLDDDEKGVGNADTLGGEQSLTIINESGLYSLILTSRKPEAKRFKKWVTSEVLPSIRKTGGYQIASVEPQSQAERKISEEMAFLDGACRILRLSESGKVAMLAAYAEQKGFPSLALPGYAIDSGVVTAGSSMPTKALTELLKDHHVATSTKKFNLLLESVGVIERLPRKNSVGGITEFWSITDAGLKYGKNLTSPRNQRETQPHWYIEKFPDLLKQLDMNDSK